jgi:ribosome-associated toxin RatA of RatAB toxin-antitoxin module
MMRIIFALLLLKFFREGANFDVNLEDFFGMFSDSTEFFLKPSRLAKVCIRGLFKYLKKHWHSSKQQENGNVKSIKQ